MRVVNVVYLRVITQVDPCDVKRSLRLKLKLRFDGVSKMTNVESSSAVCKAGGGGTLQEIT